jgi:hypothetical protein
MTARAVAYARLGKRARTPRDDHGNFLPKGTLTLRNIEVNAH